MPEYDFHQLSAHDLELLTRDLLQAHWMMDIESFKSGKDGGVDLRHASGPHKTIIQVKHYHRTGLRGLVRDLQAEAAKVRTLSPSRYLLVTSVPLSAGNKDEIVAAIGPDLLKPQDVIGQEGLNDLLGQHPEVEGRHFKLWLASRGVLDRVLNNAAVTNSEFKAQQVYEKARRYVQSNTYPRAMEIISKNGILVISGAPGVGKTTLADLLLYTHLEDGYQAIIVQKDIDEAANLFQRGTRQIFYFDDFMGATFLGENGLVANGDDRVLLDFISMIRSDSDSRLVLTTREHIYAQAMGRSERLRNSEIDDFRVVLSMPAYSIRHRAQILYNHLYFSELPHGYRAELLKNDFYMKIVRHEKFNPRLIEWLSTFRRVKQHPVEQYQAFVTRLLQDPSEIWQHAYEHEITDASRSLLLALVSVEGSITAESLKVAFDALHRTRAARYGFNTAPSDYRNALRDLNGSFIKPSGKAAYEVLDPSVLDLMNSILRQEPDNAIDILSGAVGFVQVQQIWKIAGSNGGDPIRKAMVLHQMRFADRCRTVAMQDRRNTGTSGVYYTGPTFETRLTTTFEMAEHMPGGPIAALIQPLYERLRTETANGGGVLSDVPALLEAAAACKVLPPDLAADIARSLVVNAIEEARKGCSLGELRDLVNALEIDPEADGSSLEALQEAFDKMRDQTFDDELRECRSPDAFEGLKEDLELLGDAILVDVDGLLERVNNASGDHYGNGSDRDDYAYDRYKDSRAESYFADKELSEMFGSLRDES
ncbi:restriction endonuclease [Devosia sp. 1635]|uniref:nSTAND3 domain-containing NTPase n=1 Tax=Devosia sp. 1635 TaxID=2726066 RepID=UPI001567A639